MKIIFLGTPGFAVPSLQLLVENGYDVVAVVTAPDKQAGRGLQIKGSAVKEYAISKGLRVLQPVKLSDPVFLDEVRALKADLQIVVAFRMMPEALWNMPPLGTFNLHASLLPLYRGAAPINRAVMNGEKMTGVTTFFLKHEIDTGDIIFREETEIGPNDTAGELHDKLMISGAKLVLKTVQSIQSGTVKEVPQSALVAPGEILKSAPKLFAPDFKIDWNRKAADIHNQIRGLSPFPGAITSLINKEGQSFQLKVFRSELTGIAATTPPGTLQTGSKQLLVSCGDELISLIEIQQEGKKRLSASSFLAGFRMEKEWHLE
jgi:methionyl-tRNA formyltransferase